ncbi:MAG: hypothetical protein IT288_04305 [Bdellovibrionales bacterium]|nr:hypothetical protein [Bdellovibrionales bacterium]
MKKLILATVMGLALQPLAWGRGGDLGGGGMARAIERTVRMSPQKINQLRQMNNEEAVFSAWLNTLSVSEREQVMKIVFEYQILPQLEGQ